MHRVHFSSKSDEWSTPNWLFDLLDAECAFTRDACAKKENAKCQRYFSPEVDGLNQEWPPGEVLWLNPPYSDCARWVEKAYLSALAGATVVCLIPARTDTIYWHRFIAKGAYEIRFLKGRLKFGDAKSSAPFPSAIVIFKPGKNSGPRVRFVDLAEVQRSLFGC
jgi:site-specific DNA-methyltransferase (adenine-specific)